MEFVSALSIAERCQAMGHCTTAVVFKGMQTNFQSGPLLIEERKPEVDFKPRLLALPLDHRISKFEQRAGLV